MDILIIATHDCKRRPVLEKQLQKLSIPYRLQFIEDDPGLARKYELTASPNLVIDGDVLFRGDQDFTIPRDGELKILLALKLFDQGISNLSRKKSN